VSLALADGRLLGHDDVRVPPLHIWTPPRTGSAADEVIDFMALFGRPPDAEQRLALDCLHSESSPGRWAAYTVAMVEARQQGKTGAVMLPSAMADLWLFGRQLVLWTAHLQSTADKTFADLQQLIEGCSDLSRRVQSITSGNGNHTVTLVTGAMLQFLARTGKGGRGFPKVDSLTLDEAQSLKQAHLGALLPTTAAADDPIVRMAGSAGAADAEVWIEVRDRGRAGSEDPDKGDPTLAYIEWGARFEKCRLRNCQHGKGTHGCQLDNPVRRQEANHTMRSALVPDGRNSPNTIEAFRQSMGAEEFAREILTWWGDGPGGTAPKPIPKELWEAREDESSLIVGSIAIGIEIPPSRASASVGVAGFRDDGRAHLELARSEPGVDWVVAQVAKMVAEQDLFEIQDGKVARPAIVGDKLALGPLMPAFAAAGIVPVLLGTAELVEACGGLQDDFENDKVRHIGQQELTDMLDAAVKRDVGDGGWLWGKRLSAAAGVDISGVPAITNANWALSHHQAQPFFGARR
jgi:hypothetical protein